MENSALSVELLNRIGAIAVEAAGVRVKERVALLDLPDNQYSIIDKDGDLGEIKRKPQPPRSHRLESLDDVIRYVKSRVMAGETPVVWVDGWDLVVTNDADRLRNDRAVTALEFSSVWTIVNDLPETGYSQPDMIRLLKIALARAVDKKFRVALLNMVRKMKTVEANNIGQGSGSFEAGITSTATDATDWPDSLTITTKLYEDPLLKRTFTVEVDFEATVNSRQYPFVLTAIADDLTRAKQDAQAEILDVLRGSLENVNVFAGCP